MNFPQRAARNEEIFRQVNERIEQGAERHDVHTPLPFHCECARRGCVETIELAPPEYDRIAANPARFILARGHEDESIERIVERTETFFVVEKTGEAQRQIERDHPRQRHQNDPT